MGETAVQQYNSGAVQVHQLAESLEQVLLGGNLAQLSAGERLQYYKAVCESVGLNPLTKPFEYITLNGKLTLYAKKDCTDQLRSIHNVSIQIVGREVVEGTYVVTARATMPNGRQDESIGAVPLEGLKGETRSNALMKGETKAKRRVTLSICGLGMLDETEVDSIEPQHKRNTKAEQAQFAQERVAQLSKELGVNAADVPWEAEPAKLSRVRLTDQQASVLLEIQNSFDASQFKSTVLPRFGEIKERLERLRGHEDGEARYYEILADYGVKKSTGFQTRIADAKMCFEALFLQCAEWATEKEPPADRLFEDSGPVQTTDPNDTRKGKKGG